MVELPVGRRAHWKVELVSKLEVQDKHDDQALFILNRDHIHKAGKAHTCLERAHKYTPVFRLDIQIFHLNQMDSHSHNISIDVSENFPKCQKTLV